MLFGAAVAPAGDATPAAWIPDACRGAGWTVGALVPDRYRSVLHIPAPDAEIEDWWSAYRDVYAAIATVGQQHTSRPDTAWFGIWEGHGFGRSITRLAWREPVDDDTRRALEARRSALRIESERRNADVRAGLLGVPTFDMPDRRYYLLTGRVTAVTLLRDPDPDVGWRNPDLFWPDDRRWFAATDVDIWSVYVGGTHELVAALADAVSTESEVVDLAHPLEIER